MSKFERFEIITAAIDLVLDDETTIPAGSVGRIVRIDPRPAGVVPPARWFGYAVHFGGYMTTGESIDCAIDELAVV